MVSRDSCVTKGGSMSARPDQSSCASPLVNTFTHRGRPHDRDHSLGLRIVLALLVSLMAGCTFLPSAGPSAERIRGEAGRAGAAVDYQLLPVNADTLQALSQFGPKPSYAAAGGRGVQSLFRQRGIEALGQGSSQAIQAGDIVHVAIFESGGGLFQPMAVDGRGGGTPVTSLPAQQIDQVGEITVPYAGRVRAIGQLPGDLEKEIQNLLVGKTVDPQVIVNVAKREGGDLVSVGGDVKAPKLVPVSLAGTRLIDAITAAGGATARPHEAMVTVTRNGVTRSDSLQSVYDNPGKNILLQPTDNVLVRNVAINYMVFGAGGTVGTQPIEVEDLTLAQAMARSGGPNDLRANPAAVFVYRQESRKLVESLGYDNLPPGDGTVPVIYQLELQRPEGFFYANNFSIRDRDILYYANAGSIGVGKFMALVNTMLSPVMTTASGAATVRVLGPGF